MSKEPTLDAAVAGVERKDTQVPEWEHAAVDSNAKERGRKEKESKGVTAAFVGKLDSVLPPHRRYVGLSRNTFVWLLLALVIALLVLIIGLAAGLSGNSSQNLPLPSNEQKHTGDLTYFETGLGACGWTNGQYDDIVSISHFVFDAVGSSSSTGGNSNANPLCGKMLRASRFDEQYGAQRSVDLKVVDRCTGCEPTDLDTTLGAFEKLAPSASGRVDVTWAWLEPVATKT